MNYMKGLEPLQMAFVSLVITLIIVAASVAPLQAAIDQAIANNAELTAQNVRSAINIMHEMPSGTEHIIKLESKNCEINIGKASISVKIKDVKSVLSIIMTDVIITAPDEIRCEQQSTITLRKTGNEIQVT